VFVSARQCVCVCGEHVSQVCCESLRDADRCMCVFLCDCVFVCVSVCMLGWGLHFVSVWSYKCV